MITIIIGTNRKDSNSAKIANLYSQLLTNAQTEHKVLHLENRDILHRNEEVLQIENEYLFNTQKFIFILPEYNGSFPGIFKLLIDNSDIKNAWWYKKVMLVGVADGRGGNLRGLDHISNMLHYMRMNLYFHKVYLSQIRMLLDDNGYITDPVVMAEIDTQIKGYLEY